MLCEQVDDGMDDDDPRKSPKLKHQVFIPEIDQSKEQRIILGHSTGNSKLKLVCGMDHQLSSEGHYDVKTTHNQFMGKVTYTVEAKKGKPVTLTKFITYHSSSPFPTMEELADRAERTLDRAVSQGFDHITKIQRSYLDEFWKRSDIKITGKDPRVNQHVRFHLFHLLQASERVQNSGIGAKGLTGSGYEGHSLPVILV